MIGAQDEQFYGYCYPFKDSSWHTPPVQLNGCQEAVGYVQLQKNLFHQVLIVGEDEKVVLHAVAGNIVFPVPEKGGA